MLMGNVDDYHWAPRGQHYLEFRRLTWVSADIEVSQCGQ